jgi:hypothetical protein
MIFIKFDSSGLLVPTFGTGGIVTIDYYGFSDRIISMMIDNFGQLVGVGSGSTAATASAFGAIVRVDIVTGVLINKVQGQPLISGAIYQYQIVTFDQMGGLYVSAFNFKTNQYFIQKYNETSTLITFDNTFNGGNDLYIDNIIINFFSTITKMAFNISTQNLIVSGSTVGPFGPQSNPNLLENKLYVAAFTTTGAVNLSFGDPILTGNILVNGQIIMSNGDIYYKGNDGIVKKISSTIF